MKTFVVPMFAIVRARSKEEAIDTIEAAKRATEASFRFHASAALLFDEALDPFAFDPERHEPNSVTNRDEIAIKE